MSWFSDFVADAVETYRKLNEAALKAASFKEKLDAILAEQVVMPAFIGHVGERFIEAAVAKKGCEAVRSPGSRSPADVWGHGVVDNVIHIPLVQVKATRKDRAAATLSTEEERRLSDFSLFVADHFVKSAKVPAESKQRPLLVSVGYAGVVIDWLGMGATDYDTRCINAAGSKPIIQDWKRWGAWLDEFYKTLRP